MADTGMRDGAKPIFQIAPDTLRTAAIEALVAGVVALGLMFPIVMFETVTDPNNQLILESRFKLSLILAFVVAAIRFAIALWQAGALTVPSSIVSSVKLPAEVKDWGTTAGISLLVIYPALIILLVGWGGVLKWVDNFGVQILIYVMLAWGLNIVVGLAGLLDLGYVAFYAVGAYTYAILATSVIPATYPELGPYAFWVCLPVAGLLAAFWGILLGFPVLRLRGDYLAIVTLAFGEIVRLVLINWVSLSNGYAGITTPRITFFGLPFTSRGGDEVTFSQYFGLTGNAAAFRSIFLYYVIFALALVVAIVTERLRRLPLGRAWEALREDEIACRSLGINTVKTKLAAFAIGAMFGGFAGAFFGARQGHVSPKSFEFLESATILAIVVLGGMGSLMGVAIAAVVIIGGIELLREIHFFKAIFGPQFDPAQYRMLLFGLAMVLMMIWKPRGLVSERTPSIVFKEKKAVSVDLVSEGRG